MGLFARLLGPAPASTPVARRAGRTAPSHTNQVRPTLEALEDRLQPSAGPAASLGEAAPFAVLAVNGGSLSINNSAIVGDIGVGPQATSRIGNTDAEGTLFLDPTARLRPARGQGNNDISGGSVSRDLAQAVNDANAASIADAALTPTRVLGRVTDSITVTGNGGTNVIQLTSLQYNRDTLTIHGGPNDTFVFNVRGRFDFAQSQIVLSGGVTANRVIFNFPDRGPAIHLSHASSVIQGTFLAPHRSLTADGPGAFDGAIVAHTISLQGGDLTAAPFLPFLSQGASLSGRVALLLPDGTFYQPLEGAVVSLYDSEGVLVATATTNADGFYQFTDLAPGTYTLQTSASASVPGTVDGNPNGAGGEGNDTISDVVLGQGGVGSNYDFVDYFSPG